MFGRNGKFSLTPREEEVVVSLSETGEFKRTAFQLGIRPKTMQTYVRRIKDKRQLENDRDFWLFIVFKAASLGDVTPTKKKPTKPKAAKPKPPKRKKPKPKPQIYNPRPEPEYTPTLEQIRDACAVVQLSWSPTVSRQREEYYARDLG